MIKDYLQEDYRVDRPEEKENNIYDQYIGRKNCKLKRIGYHVRWTAWTHTYWAIWV